MPAEQLARPDQRDRRFAERRAVDLAERNGDAERARGAREAHRLERVAHRDLGAARLGRRNARCGQQRAFDLHEVHVGRVGDRGVAHRRAHAGRDRFDMRQPAEVLGRHIARVRAAERERGPAAVRFGAFEHDEVGRHGALGAAGHDEAHLGGALARQMALEHEPERLGG